MKTHTVLTHEDWAKLKPMLQSHKISFNPCGYGEYVYVGFEVDELTYNKIEELLKQI